MTAGGWEDALQKNSLLSYIVNAASPSLDLLVGRELSTFSFGIFLVDIKSFHYSNRK